MEPTPHVNLDPSDNDTTRTSLDDMTTTEFKWTVAPSCDSEVLHYRDITRDQIRLLKILPDSSEPFLHFELKTFDRASAPSYCAISYVWGIDKDPFQVFIDEKLLLIRENLATCLASVIEQHFHENSLAAEKVQFRSYLWVDAVCINQGNVDERNHQVRHMDLIYRDAETVLVWLGIKRQILGPHVSPNKATFWTDNILRLANANYWSRMWVVQEFAMAKNILIGCGDEWTTEKEFFDRFNFRDPDIRAAKFARPSWSPRILPLDTLLEKYRFNRSSDLRDRINACLGCIALMDKKRLGRYLPDYTLSFTETAIVVLAHACHFGTSDKLGNHPLLQHSLNQYGQFPAQPTRLVELTAREFGRFAWPMFPSVKEFEPEHMRPTQQAAEQLPLRAGSGIRVPFTTCSWTSQQREAHATSVRQTHLSTPSFGRLSLTMLVSLLTIVRVILKSYGEVRSNMRKGCISTWKTGLIGHQAHSHS